jgi:hypothetical protein
LVTYLSKQKRNRSSTQQKKRYKIIEEYKLHLPPILFKNYCQELLKQGNVEKYQTILILISWIRVKTYSWILMLVLDCIPAITYGSKEHEPAWGSCTHKLTHKNCKTRPLTLTEIFINSWAQYHVKLIVLVMQRVAYA